MLRIALIYTIYFLYFEPIIAFLGGIYGFTNPDQVILGATPPILLSSASAPITPLIKLLVSQVSSLYLLFAWNQGIILRVTSDIKVWKALFVGMVISDVGHLFSLCVADPSTFFDVLSWRSTDWINEGTLLMGLALRVAFLMGFGVGKEKSA